LESIVNIEFAEILSLRRFDFIEREIKLFKNQLVVNSAKEELGVGKVIVQAIW